MKLRASVVALLLAGLPTCCQVPSSHGQESSTLPAVVMPPTPRPTPPSVGSTGWVSLDYLMWWQRGSSVPPLVTASEPGTPQVDAGVLGEPTTQTLFGDGSLGNGLRSGLRVHTGLWLDDAQNWALEFDYLLLEDASDRFDATSDGSTILARPFVDANTGQPISELVSFPNTIQGNVSAIATSQGLTGWGAGARYNLFRCCDPCGGERVDLLVGYRHLRLDDGLQIQEQLTSPFFPAGTLLTLTDTFGTENRFDGVELGLIDTLDRGRWRLSALGKVALGQTRSRIQVNGSTTITSPFFPPFTQEGGLYALESNIGRVDVDEFSAIFEVGLFGGYRLAPSLWFNFGYSFLCWPSVYRAAEQIDPTINPNLIPPVNRPVNGPLRPTVPMNDQVFWAQGLQFGIEYRF